MRPNSKYLVKANTIAIAQGAFVEGITEEGDQFALTRDIEGLTAYAKDCMYDSLEDMLKDLDVKAEDLIGVPFLIYGSGRTYISQFAADGLVAVLDNNDNEPEDFWPQQPEI